MEKSPQIIPIRGAAMASVPKALLQVALEIDGLPGKHEVVKVNAPVAMEAGISSTGKSTFSKIESAIGYITKTTTRADTPLKTSIAQEKTTPKMMNFLLKKLVTVFAIE